MGITFMSFSTLSNILVTSFNFQLQMFEIFDGLSIDWLSLGLFNDAFQLQIVLGVLHPLA